MTEQEENKILVKEVLTELGLDPCNEHELFERLYLRAKFYCEDLNRQDLKSNLIDWVKAELKSQRAKLIWSLQYAAVEGRNNFNF